MEESKRSRCHRSSIQSFYFLSARLNVCIKGEGKWNKFLYVVSMNLSIFHFHELQIAVDLSRAADNKSSNFRSQQLDHKMTIETFSNSETFGLWWWRNPTNSVDTSGSIFHRLNLFSISRSPISHESTKVKSLDWSFNRKLACRLLLQISAPNWLIHKKILIELRPAIKTLANLIMNFFRNFPTLFTDRLGIRESFSRFSAIDSHTSS